MSFAKGSCYDAVEEMHRRRVQAVLERYPEAAALFADMLASPKYRKKIIDAYYKAIQMTVGHNV